MLLKKLHKLSRLIWQKLIFFKVRRLQQQRGGRGSYGRRKRTSRWGGGGTTHVRACGWWRPGGRLLEVAASLTRCQARGGPRAPADLLPHRSVRWPREGETSWEPRRGDSSPRLEGAGAAPARPPAPRPDQWKHLNLKVPPYAPPTPHVHCRHGNAHRKPLWYLRCIHTYTRENYTDIGPAQ